MLVNKRKLRRYYRENKDTIIQGTIITLAVLIMLVYQIAIKALLF